MSDAPMDRREAYCRGFGAGYEQARRDARKVRTTPALTEAELAILRGIVAGLTNSEIAALVGKTTNTVRIQAHRILERTDSRNRVVLAVRAVRDGWV